MSGLFLLWMPSQYTKAKGRRGERKRGSTVPLVRMQSARRDEHAGVLRREPEAIRNSLIVLHFGRRHRAALYAARVLVRASVSVTIETSGA